MLASLKITLPFSSTLTVLLVSLALKWILNKSCIAALVAGVIGSFCLVRPPPTTKF